MAHSSPVERYVQMVFENRLRGANGWEKKKSTFIVPAGLVLQSVI